MTKRSGHIEILVLVAIAGIAGGLVAALATKYLRLSTFGGISIGGGVAIVTLIIPILRGISFGRMSGTRIAKSQTKELRDKPTDSIR